jgi:hypothetical protein
MSTDSVAPSREVRDELYALRDEVHQMARQVSQEDFETLRSALGRRRGGEARRVAERPGPVVLGTSRPVLSILVGSLALLGVILGGAWIYDALMEQRAQKTLARVSYRPETYTVKKPVYETVMEEETYTVQKPVVETVMRDETYTDYRPVVETVMEDQTYIVQRPVKETSYRDEVVTVKRPRTETVMQELQVVVSKPVYEIVYYNGIPTMIVRYVDEMQSRWNPVQRTCMASTQEVRKVPVESIRYVEEQAVRKVPVERTRYVEEQKVRKVPTQQTRYVSEAQTRQAPKQVVRYVEEQRVRFVRADDESTPAPEIVVEPSEE